MDDFASKLEEWFLYYDPNFLEVPATLRLSDFKDQRVLEIGCATGKSTLQAFKNASAYFAVDSDARVIDFCKAKYIENNLFFLCGNVESLPFRSKYFDIAYLPWVFNYIKNKDLAVSELSRVLKPNGKLILVDNSEKCDLDEILSGITSNEDFDPKQAYELPLTEKFRLVRKSGPLEIPYVFTSFEKAFELLKFIVEDFLGIELDESMVHLLNKNLCTYMQKDGTVIFCERPLLYLFSLI